MGCSASKVQPSTAEPAVAQAAAGASESTPAAVATSTPGSSHKSSPDSTRRVSNARRMSKGNALKGSTESLGGAAKARPLAAKEFASQVKQIISGGEAAVIDETGAALNSVSVHADPNQTNTLVSKLVEHDQAISGAQVVVAQTNSTFSQKVKALARGEGVKGSADSMNGATARQMAAQAFADDVKKIFVGEEVLPLLPGQIQEKQDIAKADVNQTDSLVNQLVQKEMVITGAEVKSNSNLHAMTTSGHKLPRASADSLVGVTPRQMAAQAIANEVKKIFVGEEILPLLPGQSSGAAILKADPRATAALVNQLVQNNSAISGASVSTSNLKV